MRKRIFQLIVVLLMCVPMAQAQVNDDFEILFTDEVGEEEVIEVPEALTMRLAIDSMLTLYQLHGGRVCTPSEPHAHCHGDALQSGGA